MADRIRNGDGPWRCDSGASANVGVLVPRLETLREARTSYELNEKKATPSGELSILSHSERSLCRDCAVDGIPVSKGLEASRYRKGMPQSHSWDVFTVREADDADKNTMVKISVFYQTKKNLSMAPDAR